MMKVFQSRRYVFGGVAVIGLVLLCVTWYMLARPLPNCEVAERASQALANRNYKKYWRYMGDLTRGEFNHDRASFLKFAEVVIDPLWNQGDWGGKIAFRDDVQACTIVYGNGVGLVEIAAANTGKRSEVITSPWNVALVLHLAKFDIMQLKKSESLALMRETLRFFENHREVCVEHGFLVPESLLVGTGETLVTVDQKILSMQNRIAELEVKLQERESASR